MALAGTLEIQMLANIARLQKDMNDAKRIVGTTMSAVEKSVDGVKRAMMQLGVGLSFGVLTRQLIMASDEFTKIDAQLRITTKSQQQYNQALADVRSISTTAQSELSATAALYTRLMNATTGMGVSQEKIATITQTVAFGLKAFGASSQEAASAQLQLSQAFGANRLGGEEFRAVMESMPNVMKVLAASMGVPLGQLKALSAEGKITTAEMVKAFGDPAVAQSFRQMAESAQTVSGAWTVLRNETTLLFGQFAKQSGATGGMMSVLGMLTELVKLAVNYIDDIIVAIAAWAAVTGGKLVASMVSAQLNQIALNAAHVEALALNVAIARAEAVNALAARDTAAARAWQTGITTQLTAANARLAASTSAVAGAETLLAASNRGMMSRISSMVGKGGMIGLAIWGVYEISDHLGWIDRIFNSAEDRISGLQQRINGMQLAELEHEQALLQKEVARQRAIEAQRKQQGAYGLVVGGIMGENQDLSVALRQLNEINKAIAARSAELHAPAAEALADTDKQKKAYESLANKIAEYDARLLEQLETGKKLTEADKLAIKVKMELSAAQQVAISGALAKAKADETALAEAQTYNRLVELATARRAEENESLSQNLKSVVDGTKAMRDSTAEIGLTAEALTALKLARIQDTIAIQQRKLAILDAGFETEEIARIRATIAALEDRQTAVVEQSAKAMRDTLSTNISGGIISGFKAGDGAAKIFEDTTTQMFEQMVLEPQIKAAVTAGVDWTRELLLSTTAQGRNTLALERNTAALGSSSGTSGAAAGSGYMSTLGTVGSYAMIAYMVYSMFTSSSRSESGIKGTVGQDGISAQRWRSDYSSGSLLGGGGYNRYTESSLSVMELSKLNQAFLSVRNNVSMFASQLGLGAEALMDYTAAFNISGTKDSISALIKSTSNEMSAAVLGINVDDVVSRVLDLYEHNVNTARARSGLGSVEINSLSQVALRDQAGLRRQIDDKLDEQAPMWVKQLRLEGEGLYDTLSRVAPKVAQTRGFLDALGSSLESVWSQGWRIMDGVIMRMDAFVDALGGLDEASKKMSSWISGFADDATLQSLAEKQLTSLGLPLLSTTEEWFNFSKTASEEQLTAILNNQPAIQAWLDALNKVRTAQDAATKAAEDAAKAEADRLIALAKTNLGWQQQIDVLTGASSQRQIDLANALDGVDASTAKLINRLFKLQDQAQATADAEALAKTNASIQQQIDVLTGEKTQRQVDLENALVGVDSTTAILIKQFYSLKDAADATAAALDNIKTSSFSTFIEYQRAIGRAMNPAATLQLPSYAVGTPFVPHDMVAQIHRGERITTASANDELVTEIKALRSEVSALRSSAASTATNTKRSTDLLYNMTDDGQSLRTTAA